MSGVADLAEQLRLAGAIAGARRIDESGKTDGDAAAGGGASALRQRDKSRRNGARRLRSWRRMTEGSTVENALAVPTDPRDPAGSIAPGK